MTVALDPDRRYEYRIRSTDGASASSWTPAARSPRWVDGDVSRVFFNEEGCPDSHGDPDATAADVSNCIVETSVDSNGDNRLAVPAEINNRRYLSRVRFDTCDRSVCTGTLESGN